MQLNKLRYLCPKRFLKNHTKLSGLLFFGFVVISYAMNNIRRRTERMAGERTHMYAEVSQKLCSARWHQNVQLSWLVVTS